MLFLLALPIFCGVALAHRYLQLYAPSNVLIRSVRYAPPRWGTAVALLAVAVTLLLAMHAVVQAIAAGAPGWLNLVVLVLAWDAIKFAAAAAVTTLRALAAAGRRMVGRVSSSSSPSRKRGESDQRPRSASSPGRLRDALRPNPGTGLGRVNEPQREGRW